MGDSKMHQGKSPSTDGFEITGRLFNVPSNVDSLDQATKRTITICNLFVNHHLALSDIVALLDENYSHVVHVLIGRKLILERRKTPREPSTQVKTPPFLKR